MEETDVFKRWLYKVNHPTLLAIVIALNIISYFVGYNLGKYIITSIALYGLGQGMIFNLSCWGRMIVIIFVVGLTANATEVCTKRHSPVRVIGGVSPITKICRVGSAVYTIIAVVRLIAVIISNFINFGFGWILLLGLEKSLFWALVASAFDLIRYVFSSEAEMLQIERELEK